MLIKIPGKKSHRKSDEELLSEFCSTGDLEILGELYSGYMHLVYGVCLKYLKDSDESMDAVMQIFEKLIIELARHKVENFRNWLHIVTKNYCLMYLRSERSIEQKHKEWLEESAVFMETGQFLHPIDDDRQETEKALADCIERLKGEQKECIRQFYFEDRCYNEIAVSMDINEKKVKSYLQNAKRNLKLCLEEKNVRQE